MSSAPSKDFGGVSDAKDSFQLPSGSVTSMNCPPGLVKAQRKLLSAGMGQLALPRMVATGPTLHPTVVDTPLPFSQGVVTTMGGGALAESSTCTEALAPCASLSVRRQTMAVKL